MHVNHAHGHAEDPLRVEEMPARWEAWAHLFEPATACLTEALLDAAHVTAGSRVVDAACGIGPTTAAAHARGAEVLGIDLHPDMVARARRRHPDVPFELRDMRDLPARRGGWDAVVCRFGAHHVDSDAWFRHVCDRLRPGGRIAIAEWGTGTEVPLFHALAGEGHVAVERPPGDWVAALSWAGFRHVTLRRVDVAVPFGDEATWRRFLAGMHGMGPEAAARTRAALAGGVQHNAAFVVSGTA